MQFVSVVIYEGQSKERRYRVLSGKADALIELLDGDKRFWEWEAEIKLLREAEETRVVIWDC